MEKSQTPVHPVAQHPPEESSRFSGIAFPAYGLADSVAVANAIHNKGGGYATREQLAAFLEYASTTNGAYLSRVGAAKLFGLLLEEDKRHKLSPLAIRILMPESDEERRSALVDAFFTVPLFKSMYDEYSGKGLPEGLGLKNALRVKFKVVPGRIDVAYRAFFDSAETAGFFETRGGSKTQLIMPVLRPSPIKPPEQKNGEHEGGGGGGSANPPPPLVTRSKEDLWNDYIGTLIGALRDKSGKEGEMDKDLMERIERLLELKKA
jgi:hypothetical protein